MDVQIITAFQISTSFMDTFNVDWPSSLISVMTVLNFTKLDLLQLPGPACIAETMTYTELLLVKTLGPLVLAFIVSLPALFVACAGWKKTRYPIYEKTVDRFW